MSIIEIISFYTTLTTSKPALLCAYIRVCVCHFQIKGTSWTHVIVFNCSFLDILLRMKQSLKRRWMEHGQFAHFYSRLIPKAIITTLGHSSSSNIQISNQSIYIFQWLIIELLHGPFSRMSMCLIPCILHINLFFHPQNDLKFSSNRDNFFANHLYCS